MVTFAAQMVVYYLILFGTVVLILYAYRTVHLLTHRLRTGPKWGLRFAFLLVTVLVYASTSYLAVNREDFRDNELVRSYTVVGAITLAVTLLSICLFQLVADVVLLLRHGFFRASGRHGRGEMLPRRVFLNQMALTMGGLMLGSFLWGTTKGRFGWRIIENQLSFSNLPQAFDGLRIVQISDLHLGSFEKNYGPIEEAIGMINELEADYIFFTGDLVNESPKEADAWVEIIRKLQAKSGKYAILGNHDYGWGRGGELTEDMKTTNANGVAQVFEQMDLKPLLNAHAILERDGQRIGLVGVENWGWSEQNWFPTRGDYGKATEGMAEVPFKILLSHDPTHWDHHILGKERVDLTLSGHTHGGQVGVSIPGLVELSAGKFFYERYAGLYTEGDQHLYVNRGMGYLIFPGRVGMPPEITLHVLNRV